MSEAFTYSPEVTESVVLSWAAEKLRPEKQYSQYYGLFLADTEEQITIVQALNPQCSPVKVGETTVIPFVGVSGLQELIAEDSKHVLLKSHQDTAKNIRALTFLGITAMKRVEKLLTPGVA